MHESSEWRRSKLSKILRETTLSRPSLAAVEDYLCTNEKQLYQSIEELAKRHHMTTKDFERLIEQYNLFIQRNYTNEETLENVFSKVNGFIETYKGAIEIDSWINFARNELYLDSLSAKRYLRFTELIQNRIHIDPQKMIFWDRRDKCLACQKLITVIENYYRQHITDIKKIQRVCLESKCPVKPHSILDTGILKYHNLIMNNPTLSVLNINTPQTSIQRFTDTGLSVKLCNNNDSQVFNEPHLALIIQKSLKLTSSSKKLLDYLIKNQEGVSDAKIQAFGKMHKINVNSSLSEINENSFALIKQELAQLDSENMMWKVNFGHLSTLDMYNKKPCRAKDIADSTDEANKVFNNNDSFNNFDLLELFVQALNNSRTSYKFYWAESLCHCAKQDRTAISLKRMASLMCSFAIGDFSNKEYKYSKEDYIPEILYRLRKIVTIPLDDGIDSICKLIIPLLSSYEVTRLTASVKKHFIPLSYWREYEVTMISHKLSKRGSSPQENDVFLPYIQKASVVYLGQNFCDYVKEHFDEFKTLIDTKKQRSLVAKKED